MKLKITAFKPSGKFHDEFTVEVSAMHAWQDGFKAELRSAISHVHPDWAYLVENAPEEVLGAKQAGKDLPFHHHLYYPGDLKP